jgi:hypothetical protein
MSRTTWRAIARLIGALTVLAGAVQTLAPGFIARLIGAAPEPATLQFAATVGMFMVLFGGMLLQATREGPLRGRWWRGAPRKSSARRSL